MNDLVKKIEKIPNLYSVKGCTNKQIKEAQNDLDIVFPEEYIDYMKKFGAISFYGTEWTGLNVNGHLNVVESTKQERKMNDTMPLKCYVIENQGIDGIITIADEEGKIYTLQYNKKEYLCDSLSDYLDICIARKKDRFSSRYIFCLLLVCV